MAEHALDLGAREFALLLLTKLVVDVVHVIENGLCMYEYV
jgi:hypothetical protein